MHIFFSGIGGAGIGPLAMLASQAGYEVSGSDKQDSQYITYLKKHGITDVHIGQTTEAIAQVHAKKSIDWFVYSSAIEKESLVHAELLFVRSHRIKHTKRDKFINHFLQEKKLKMIAIAGTHGKTTATAMVVWLMKQLNVTFSYLLPAKTSFAQMGEYQEGSEYLVYECDEFDRNFLQFKPYLNLITGVAWDHHEIFPTRDDYKQAFRDFINQSRKTILWQQDMDYLGMQPSSSVLATDPNQSNIASIKIPGRYNRQDAWLAILGVAGLTHAPYDKLIEIMDNFPGLQRRMEQIIPGLYSDYAHTPEKIRGAVSVATEMAIKANQKLVVVYEPLTNRRQHYMLNDYGDCFMGAAKVYWIPSYLAREDPAQPIIPPQELICHLSDPSIAEPRQRDQSLKQTIQNHLDQGDMVVAMAGGGGDSLDEWVRVNFNIMIK